MSVAGLNTTVLPQTSAGMIFHDGIAIGKFHGVMIAQTPSGWRTDIANLSRSSEGTVWPYRRRPSPAMKNVMSIASCTSPRVSSSTFPISRVMSRASVSLRSAMSCAARKRISARRRRRHEAPARIGASRRVERPLQRPARGRLLEKADRGPSRSAGFVFSKTSLNPNARPGAVNKVVMLFGRHGSRVPYSGRPLQLPNGPARVERVTAMPALHPFKVIRPALFRVGRGETMKFTPYFDRRSRGTES